MHLLKDPPKGEMRHKALNGNQQPPKYPLTTSETQNRVLNTLDKIFKIIIQVLGKINITCYVWSLNSILTNILSNYTSLSKTIHHII